MDTMNIHVHLGAHKTATTYLQNFLKSQRQILRRYGIGYLPLGLSRSIFFPAVRRLARQLPPIGPQPVTECLRERVKRAIRFNDETLPSIHTLVLSDENFAGALADLSKSGELYPAISARLKILGDIFPGCRFAFFFSIRDYADFLASSYCELLRHGKLPAFDIYLSALQRESISWPALLERLRAAVPESTVYYWRYEDFRRISPDVVRLLCTIPLERISADSGNLVRTSLSRKGVAVLRSCESLLTTTEFSRLANFLAEKFEFDDDGGKLEIEDPELASQLRTQYMADCVALSAASEPAEGGIRRLRHSDCPGAVGHVSG